MKRQILAFCLIANTIMLIVLFCNIVVKPKSKYQPITFEISPVEFNYKSDTSIIDTVWLPGGDFFTVDTSTKIGDIPIRIVKSDTTINFFVNDNPFLIDLHSEIEHRGILYGLDLNFDAEQCSIQLPVRTDFLNPYLYISAKYSLADQKWRGKTGAGLKRGHFGLGGYLEPIEKGIDYGIELDYRREF